MPLGPVGQTITAKLVQAFAPAALDVIDDSHQHEGHGGSRPDGESHFTVKVVAEAFRGKSRVERHRMVNAALALELEERVHALAIHASAPESAPQLSFAALSSDDARLMSLLGGAGLPTADLASEGLSFIGITGSDGALLACGGLHLKGSAALIRSVAVAPAQRKAGLGRTITFKLLAEARNSGAVAAYLLTNTAQDYFARLGFSPVGRDKVPAPIAATSQFTGTMCSTAQAMVQALAR